MRVNRLATAMCCCASVLVALVFGSLASRASAQAVAPAEDPVRVLVGRLDLERYKATIKALTQFGDRLQGTDRNKAAIDWIEAQLKSYGCAPQRLRYNYMPAPPRRRRRRPARGASPAPDRQRRSAKRSWWFAASWHDVADFWNWSPEHRSQCSAGRCAARVECAVSPSWPARGGLLHQSRRGTLARCTSSGLIWTDEGSVEAANDNGSGTALVMELARIFSSRRRADR